MKRVSRISIALLSGMAIGGFLALSPASADAECVDWWIGGTYEFVQSNNATVVFHFGRGPKELNGTAQIKFVAGNSCLGEECGLTFPIDVVNATVDGVRNGNSIELTAYWDNGWVGYYSGTINKQGRMKGTGYERRSPDTVVTWYSKQIVGCIYLREKGQVTSPLTVEEPGTIKAQKRIKLESSNPPLEICEAARKARQRNSPAAPGLTEKCLAAGGGEATDEITE